VGASIGEQLVGAYLTIVGSCYIVDYNVRPPGGGLEGLEELDVVGLDFATETAYLCEVTTHIRGLRYGSNEETVARIAKKHRRQKQYADRYLRRFPHRTYMLWSPVVPEGYLTEHLRRIELLELVINEEYAKRVDELRAEARDRTNIEGNDVFRVLQILERLRR